MDCIIFHHDQLIIGTLLGAVQLGYYTIAAKIPEMVIGNFSLILTEVLFPVYAKLKDDRKGLIRAYLKTTKLTVFFSAGTAAGMAAVEKDVLDPAFAPGVSHPEPGGLSTRDALAFLQRLDGPVVGADLVELNPTRDPTGLTAMVAAKLAKELLALLLTTAE